MGKWVWYMGCVCVCSLCMVQMVNLVSLDMNVVGSSKDQHANGLQRHGCNRHVVTPPSSTAVTYLSLKVSNKTKFAVAVQGSAPLAWTRTTQ